MATVFKRQGKGSWIIQWYDHTGKRRERSSRTTDKKAADRIAAKLEADTALRRDGVIDANKDRFSVENRKALAQHVEEYLDHCRHAGHSDKHIVEKVRHLGRMLEGTGATRLSDLTADALERHLRSMRRRDLSARTVNFCRQITVAFMNWCVDVGRLQSNPLTVVAKLDERKDRRRVRRPLTDNELANLLAVAEPRGRKAWYMTAALAGLRKSELQRLVWADIDFDDGTITIREGKSGRVDVIPMHDQLADELMGRRDASRGTPRARVFPETVTDVTRLKDFLRAGLAREEVVTDAAGEPIMIGKGKWRRPKTRIVVEDDEGRMIDLHAMRTTLGTMLARHGTKPQVAREIMRHSDYKTTLKHYTVLGLTDTAAAINQLPPIGQQSSAQAAATGTCDTVPNESQRNDPQQIPQQLGHETVQNGAKGCDGQVTTVAGVGQPQTLVNAGSCEAQRVDAMMCDERRGCNSVVECQLPKLNVAGSNPVTRFELTRTYKRCKIAPTSFAP
jgi:integrase